MTWSEIALGALLIALLVGWITWKTASRLDRLHRKVSASRVALDSQLVRRAQAAVDLSSSEVLDPASSLLVADAAYLVLDDAGPGVTGEQALAMDGLSANRESAESNLSTVLRQALGSDNDSSLMDSPAETLTKPQAEQQIEALAAAWYRATLARRFHNEAVTQATRMRRQWWVRTARLAGRAPMPRTVELDDLMPRSVETRLGVGSLARR